jgi:cysteine desulfurase
MSNIVELDKTKRYSSKEIYLDYAALAPIDREILKKMLPYYNSKYGNPSSLHSNGRRARQILETMRGRVAHSLHALPEEIIFTGSGTEADNLAILGTAHANCKKGNHILISAIEHKAVLETVKNLEKEGFRVDIIPVDNYGMISVEKCLSLIKKETILISVMYVNNEIGTIEPIQKLSSSLNKLYPDNRPLLHVDACQATNLLSLNINELNVDLLVINSSKIYGPTGVACLYKKSGILIESIIVGGEQEKNIRAGTENIPLIVGFTLALEKAAAIRDTEYKRLKKLEEYFIKKLKEKIPEIIFNGHPKNKIPNIVHVSIPSIEGESIVLMLDQYGIRVSTGSACSAFDLRPSHVLLAIGQNPDLVHGSIRFSMGKSTTKENLDVVLEVFPKIIQKLKGISALTLKKYEKK